MTTAEGTPFELQGITVGPPVNFIGIPGGAGITPYTHTQTIPATVWVVTHNLGRYPAAVSVFNDDFSVQWSDFVLTHVNTGTLHITADIAISGKALVT